MYVCSSNTHPGPCALVHDLTRVETCLFGVLNASKHTRATVARGKDVIWCVITLTIKYNL